MRKTLSKILKVVCAATLTTGFALSGVGCSCGGNQLLKDVYKDYFKTGAMVAITPTADLPLGYEDDVLKEFNSFTAENEMKWKYTEPTRNGYTFELGDILVEKAQKLGAKVRGHALVWHESVPDYLTRSATKITLINDIKNHIYNTVTHFGHDTVYCWDVVNEAISDSQDPNTIYRSTTSGDAKASELFDIAGKDFIFEAFKAAREADPQLKLYYNDYNLNNPVKRAKCLTMLREMIAAGVPIDGVGEQAHYNIRSFDAEQFEQMIKDFTELGLKVSITELDLSVYESDSEDEMSEITPELLNLQAEVYSKIYSICRKYKDDIESVTTWGVGDDHSWLNNKNGKNRKDYPLLIDDFGDPKPAMQAIKDFNYKTPVSEDVDDTLYNIYDGKASEFHFSKWYGGGEEDGIYVEDEPATVAGQSATEVYFYKLSEYTEARSNVSGRFGGFDYVSFKLAAKANTTVQIMPQINYFVDGTKGDKCIGEEAVEITDAVKTVCIKIPAAKRTQMDLISEIWLFPEPGEKSASGNIFKGTFYIIDAWFSNTIPKDVAEDDILNPSGEGSAVSEKAYKRTGQDTWYNETGWTKINVKLSNEGLVDVKASSAATWAYVSVKLSEFDLSHNKLRVSFIDHMNSKDRSKPSVEYIRFRLRGSMLGMTFDGVNTYMTYQDKDLMDWINGGYENEDYHQSTTGGPTAVRSEVLASGDIKYTIEYDIDKEVKYINDRNGYDPNDYGLRLVMLVETVGVSAGDGNDYSIKYPKDYPDTARRDKLVDKDCAFNITITEVTTYTSAA